MFTYILTYEDLINEINEKHVWKIEKNSNSDIKAKFVHKKRFQVHPDIRLPWHNDEDHYVERLS